MQITQDGPSRLYRGSLNYYGLELFDTNSITATFANVPDGVIVAFLEVDNPAKFFSWGGHCAAIFSINVDKYIGDTLAFDLVVNDTTLHLSFGVYHTHDESAFDKAYDKYLTNLTAAKAQTSVDGSEGGFWYYDGTRVAYNIYDMTGDKDWLTIAQNTAKWYKDLVSNNAVPGYHVFARGLMEYYRRTSDESVKTALTNMYNTCQFGKNTPLSGFISPVCQRELAYQIELAICMRMLGVGGERLESLVDIALNQLDQQFIQKNYVGTEAFMTALAADILGYYYDHVYHDSRIPQYIQILADGLQKDFWRTNCFLYQQFVNEALSTDLNLLILPVYGLAYRYTGDKKYIDFGDLVFTYGVNGAYLGEGKHVSQNYRWSEDYIQARKS